MSATSSLGPVVTHQQSAPCRRMIIGTSSLSQCVGPGQGRHVDRSHATFAVTFQRVDRSSHGPSLVVPRERMIWPSS